MPAGKHSKLKILGQFRTSRYRIDFISDRLEISDRSRQPSTLTCVRLAKCSIPSRLFNFWQLVKARISTVGIRGVKFRSMQLASEISNRDSMGKSGKSHDIEFTEIARKDRDPASDARSVFPWQANSSSEVTAPRLSFAFSGVSTTNRRKAEHLSIACAFKTLTCAPKLRCSRRRNTQIAEASNSTAPV